MPKIEVDQKTFYTYLGYTPEKSELEDLLQCAKAELDGVDDDEGILKIELNDTNRPDLWSTAGLARQLKIYTGKGIPNYPFFFRGDETTKRWSRDTGERRVVVDPKLENIRPYMTAFAVTGKPLDEPGLKDLIQTQEKLCWNFGRKRKSIAMGVYRSDMIQYPVKYSAADPEATRFIPLGMDRELSLREINREHPKGIEFGHIVDDFPLFPFITDSRGDVLSFPPVINSAHIGAVEVGDENLFIELTGLELHSLTLAASIIACDLADAGHTILPVTIEYPYDTCFGRECTVPAYYQEPVEAEISLVNKMLGSEFSVEQAVGNLTRMGIETESRTTSIVAFPPEYRDDFLHPVDVVEDIMVGAGMNFFEPVLPEDFTVGRLSPATAFGRKVKDVMVGLGFQEMMYSYLGSEKDYIGKMGLTDPPMVRIANPMSENYEYVRASIFPNLLGSESVSGNGVYPHHIFEIGKVVLPSDTDNYGSETRNFLGFLSSDSGADFNMVNSQVSALFFYLSREYSLEELEDPRFIPGRAARIVYNGASCGCFGEVHPKILENWNIQMPVTLCEVDLDVIMEK